MPYTSDDSRFLQRAIDKAVARRGGVTVQLPEGLDDAPLDMELRTPIKVPTNSGLTLRGLGKGGGCVLHTMIDDPTAALFDFPNARGMLFEQFRVEVEKPLGAVFRHQTTLTAPGSITNNQNTYRGIAIEAAQSGRLGAGWQTGGPEGRDQNNEQHQWDTCDCAHADAAWSFGGAMSKANVLLNCGWAYGRIGIDATRNGTFRAFACRGGSSSDTDFALGQPYDNILIMGGDFENSARLLTTKGPSAGAWSVILEAVRWQSANLHADSYAILFMQAGPLRVIGGAIAGPDGNSRDKAGAIIPARPPKFLHYAYAPTKTRIQDVDFGTPGSGDVFPLEVGEKGRGHWYDVSGNHYRNAAGKVEDFPTFHRPDTRVP